MSFSREYSTWIEIDQAAIENNVRLLHKMTGVQVMAVVKANGYGHGSIPVAKAALRGGAAWCGVARIEEALELRQGGIDCPILVLGYTPKARFESAVAHEISMAAWTVEQAELASKIAAGVGRIAKLHLKVDTGMSRLGVRPESTLDLANILATLPGIKYEGVFTHFARADEADQSTNEVQERCFRDVLDTLASVELIPPWIHAANSAAAIARPDAKFNLIRPGIAIYGLHPSSECRLPPGFIPALSWKAVLSQVKMVTAGTGVSYGHEYSTASSERIGTLPVGYADGFRRVPGNQVLILGQHMPVIGRVCMDQVMVQLDSAPQAQEGDEAILIGSQGSERITAEEVAATWGTANYEVVCGLGARVPRVYLK
jgi:alanine racemase